GHHHPLAMQQHLSTQFSLNSSFSTDSGFDETSSNSSPTTPLPLAALYAHQRQRVDAPNICCANESTTTTIEAPTLEETTAAS
uniref:Uncharacterized protein n=1 Tax=Plectus sambesii TaxID=2011161 RepID=A0A914W799_9BILA